MKIKLEITIYYKILILFAAILCIGTAVAANKVVLTGIDGKQHAIQSFIGKGTWTLVNFWGVNCPPCRDEMPELTALQHKYSKTRVSILGIAIGYPGTGYPDKQAVRAFLHIYKVNFPVLLGNANVAVQLGADALHGLPTSLIFSPGGKLIAEHSGPVSQQGVIDFIKKYKQK